MSFLCKISRTGGRGKVRAVANAVIPAKLIPAKAGSGNLDPSAGVTCPQIFQMLLR